jgi:hypothetical protein
LASKVTKTKFRDEKWILAISSIPGNVTTSRRREKKSLGPGRKPGDRLPRFQAVSEPLWRKK